MEGCAVCEFHGFRDNNNDFIVKELALVSSSERTLIFFESPFDKSYLDSRTSRSVRWLEKNFHFISWEYGDVKYSEEVMIALCERYDTIFTKGFEKHRFLQRFHSNVKMIGDHVPKPTFEEEEVVICPLHTSGRCALHSAIFYMNWLQKHTDYTRESNRLLSFDFSDIPKHIYKAWAKKGFYYDYNTGRVICTWCDNMMEWHTACVKGSQNIPIEFDVFIPLL